MELVQSPNISTRSHGNRRGKFSSERSESEIPSIVIWKISFKIEPELLFLKSQAGENYAFQWPDVLFSVPSCLHRAVALGTNKVLLYAHCGLHLKQKSKLKT